MSLNQPTPEMIEFFEQRTHEHIDRVRKCLAVAAAILSENAEELVARGQVHDASKFGVVERIPYMSG